jgi:hypothetical protein
VELLEYRDTRTSTQLAVVAGARESMATVVKCSTFGFGFAAGVGVGVCENAVTARQQIAKSKTSIFFIICALSP